MVRTHLLETFPEARILFTSSTSVYAQRDGSRVTEESETKPIRETSRIFLEVGKLNARKGRHRRAARWDLWAATFCVVEQIPETARLPSIRKTTGSLIKCIGTISRPRSFFY